MRFYNTKPKATITIVLFLVSFLLFALFTGCKSKTIYVPVESVKTEYKDRLLKDSVYLLDSVFVYLKNDTVFFNKYRYLYKDKLIRDSIFKSDTIRIPYPVKGDTVYINRLKWYQEACMWFTSLVLVALALYMGIKYRGKIFSLFKKMIFKV